MSAPPERPIRIAVVGAGHHSRTYHLPALAHYRRLHPDIVALVGIADLDFAVALRAAAEFGFANAYADADEMLARQKPDACLAITPVALNAGMTLRLARLGVPVLMEKPPGATIDEARCFVAAVRDLNARVMVSMNRRFDPLLRDALAWIADRPICSIKALMTRRRRTEPQFVEHTGLHLVDVVRMIGGHVNRCSTLRQDVAAAGWFEARLAFASGASGVVDLMPTFGSNNESLEIAGSNYRVKIRSSEFDFGDWRAWAEGRLIVGKSIPPARPLFVANGTFAETAAFMRALRGGKHFSPTPADVLPSMELCYAITRAGSANRQKHP